jgi:hypothetical protein
MIGVDQIGQWYGLKQLQTSKEVRNHRCGSTFHEAKTICLIYLDRDEAFYNQVKAYVKFLHSEYGMRRVCALGYVNKKAKHVPVYQSQKLEYQFFTKNDTNWFQKPVSNVEVFLNESFDILIDLNMSESLSLDYIVRESRSKMKVGSRQKRHSHLYDILIDVRASQSVGPYIDQVNFVLNNFRLK